MIKQSLLAVAFVLAHVAALAAFVPAAQVLPLALGLLSVTAMALTLVLAARWRLVDRLTGGPDKSYVAHRWLGLFALGGALGHWAIASSVGAGWIPGLADGAEDLGTFAATGLLVMSAAALVRAIPYHLWKVSHMLMGPFFAVAAYHSIFSPSALPVGTAPWLAMMGLSGLGLVAWAQTLLRAVRPNPRVTVTQVVPFDGGAEVTLRAEGDLPAYRAGQFATLAHDRPRAEAHPFTIAGGEGPTRRFVIGAGGDWTNAFVAGVRPGDRLRLGRGEGRFLPQVGPARREQLWVAGGVGIAPFLAALSRMQPDTRPAITLVYCIRSRAAAGALAEVEELAAKLPQVRLILADRAKGGRLTPAQLAEVIRPMARDAQAYVCGPDRLRGLLCDVWGAEGRRARVHSERFDFRGAYSLTDLLGIGRSVLDAIRPKGSLHAPSRS